MITSQFAQKMAIPIILITIILTSSLFVEVASAQSSFRQASINVSSFGTIPSPPLPPPIQSDLLPLTGIGGDYLISYAGDDPEVWLDPYAWGGDGTMGWVDRAKLRYPQYYVSKLEFQFQGLGAPSSPSELDYAKMDRVLEIFQSRGLKVIPCLQQLNDAVNHYVAQQGFIDSWKTFVNHYKNERPDLRDTIAALAIFGEPNSVVLSDFGGNKLALVQRFAYTIQQIRTVDSTIPIIFPDTDQYYGYTTALYNQAVTDIKSALTTYGLQNDPNIYFDVGHPYWWTPTEVAQGVSNWVSTPEEKASFYCSFYQIYVNAFGANRCYVGETYGNFNQGDDAMQARWLTSIINNLYSKGIGFSLLSVLGVGGAPDFNKTLACIDASNYNVSMR